ncbi:MAG: hypothetical protein WCX74_02285 [Candidatus Paceibacterota bacterium]
MEIIVIEKDLKPGDPGFEDTYGYYALLGDLSEKYRCSKCNAFLEYGDDACTILVCPDYGFEKPAPEREKT